MLLGAALGADIIVTALAACIFAFGGWIWFGGFKIQGGYDWMNVLPPLASDMGSINFLLSTGIRF